MSIAYDSSAIIDTSATAEPAQNGSAEPITMAGRKKKLTVSDVFNNDDDEGNNDGKRKRPLVPLGEFVEIVSPKPHFSRHPVAFHPLAFIRSVSHLIISSTSTGYPFSVISMHFSSII